MYAFALLRVEGRARLRRSVLNYFDLEFMPGFVAGALDSVMRPMTVVGSSSVRISERCDLTGAKLRGPVFALCARRFFCRCSTRRRPIRRMAYSKHARATLTAKAMEREEFITREFASPHRLGASLV